MSSVCSQVLNGCVKVGVLAYTIDAGKMCSSVLYVFPLASRLHPKPNTGTRSERHDVLLRDQPSEKKKRVQIAKTRRLVESRQHYGVLVDHDSIRHA